jgi:peptidoglycan/LPS O-acetylase OafA/YrhL
LAPPVPKAPRDPGVDLVRAIACVMVVALHACVAYLSHPLPGLLWPVQEGAPTSRFDEAFWLLRALSVPVMALLAGLFAARALDVRTPAGFLRERFRRVGGALLIGLGVLVAMYLVWSWGWVRRGWASWEHVPHVRFGPAVQPNLYGLAHLWYLEYLLIWCAMHAAVVWGWRRVRTASSHRAGDRNAPRDAFARSAWVLALAALVTIVVWVWPGAVTLFQNGVVPDPDLFLFHAPFFVAGAWLQRLSSTAARARGADATLRECTPAWWVWLLGALLASPAMLDGLRQFVGATLGGQAPPSERTRLITAIATGIVAACGVGGLLGACARLADALAHRHRAASAVAWLGRASLWVYLTHLVFQGAACVLLFREEASPMAKYAIVVAAGLAGGLACAWGAERLRVR